ncbi:MFS transporter [Amycolatopsis sp.]|uniref:MFS transporter n=1 Tax=Amycolatopsis sp. TaxID=37632 RepID=UPI002E04AD05|nr:MFS transporter [Amycolatopsis sp.]
MTGRRLFADTRPLRESPAFRRLWIGSSLSSIGSRMTSFATALQIYELTHSSAAVGALALVLGVPTIVVGLLGGSFADAVDRRRLVLLTSSCLAVMSILFAVQAFLDLRQVWLLYVLAGIQALLGAVNAPARRTFLPRLLPADQLPGALALDMLSFHASLTVGPLLAGMLVATGGFQLCYLVDVVSFAAALYGLARLPPMPPLGDAARPGLKAVAEGLRFIRHKPVLLGVFLADVNATVLGMPFALFPALNDQNFGGSAQTLGLLTAAPAIGGLLGSALSGPVGQVSRHGRAMLIAGAVWGAALAGFGFTHTLWLGLVLLAVAGAADTISVIFRGTIVQAATPDRLRGRVTSVDFVVGSGAPELGNFRAGVVGSLVTPAVSAISGGIATVLGAGLLRLAVPALARYDARDPDKH